MDMILDVNLKKKTIQKMNLIVYKKQEFISCQNEWMNGS